MRLEGFGQPKNPMASSGLAPTTSRLVAYCLHQLSYRVPLPISYKEKNILAIRASPYQELCCMELIRNKLAQNAPEFKYHDVGDPRSS